MSTLTLFEELNYNYLCNTYLTIKAVLGINASLECKNLVKYTYIGNTYFFSK